ncbi:MAG: hypothetical protein ACAH83_08925 [Alphaproteobacteria bacterium]
MKQFFSAKTAAMILAAGMLAAQASMSFAAVSSEGAVDIKKQVEEAISFPLKMQKSTGMGLVLGGPIEVTPKDDYYEVKLPAVSYAMESVKADFGTLIMNVTPSGDEYKTTMAIPETINIYDAAKAPIATIKIGAQQFNGIWLPKFRAFTRIDAEYKDISILSPKAGDKVAISLGSIKSTLELSPDGNDVWSGQQNFEFANLHMTAGDKGEFDFTIDSMKGGQTYSKLNLQTRKDVEDKTEQALAGIVKDQKPDPVQMQAMLSSVISSLQNYLDGVGSAFKMSGAHMRINPGDAKGADGKPEKPVDVNLSSASWEFKMNGMQAEKGNLSLQFGMEGLSVSNMDPGTASILPTASNVEVHLDNLPIQEMSKGLSGLFSQLVSSAVASQSVTDAAQKTALQGQVQAQVGAAMLSIPAQLATAGSKLSIVNTYAKAPDVGSTLDGSFTANAASPVMAQGSVTLLITGLDELILKLQAMGQGASPDPKLLGWAQGLGMLQMMGQLGKASDGRTQRTYKLEVAADGKVLLNGADFSNAMQGMGMGAPQVGQPTPEGGTPKAPEDMEQEKTP